MLSDDIFKILNALSLIRVKSKRCYLHLHHSFFATKHFKNKFNWFLSFTYVASHDTIQGLLHYPLWVAPFLQLPVFIEAATDVSTTVADLLLVLDIYIGIVSKNQTVQFFSYLLLDQLLPILYAVCYPECLQP